MSNPLLPKTTIRHLTCSGERAAQLAELRRLGIPYRLNRAGEILITVGVLDRWISGSPEGARVRAKLEAVGG